MQKSTHLYDDRYFLSGSYERKTLDHTPSRQGFAMYCMNVCSQRYSRFVPNSPTVLRGSIPKERGGVFCNFFFLQASHFTTQATEQTLIDSLPTRKQAVIAVATARVGQLCIS